MSEITREQVQEWLHVIESAEAHPGLFSSRLAKQCAIEMFAPACRALLAALDRGDKAMRALERLTPQGSEFHEDVEACVAWVQKVKDGYHRAMKRAARYEREARAARLLLLPEGIACMNHPKIKWLDRERTEYAAARKANEAEEKEGA